MSITYAIFSSLHAMTMSPTTGPEGISLHAVFFMLRKVESTSDVNRGPEPCQSGTALNSPFRVVSQIDGAVRAYAHAHDDHYLTRSKFNSLLTEMITPQTYKNIYIHIKPLPVPRVFGARSGSPRNICMV